MKEHPIIFSTSMVRAILGGKRTMTRPVIKPQPEEHVIIPNKIIGLRWKGVNFGSITRDGRGSIAETSIATYSPYGQPGDYIYVRETHYRYGWWKRNGISKTGKQKWTFVSIDREVRYFDNPPDVVRCNSYRAKGWYKRPAIFMPRWASRITLEITAVRVERVQDISEGDAKKEGVEPLYQEPDEITNQALRSVGAEEVTQPYIIGWTNYQFKEDRRFRHIPKMSYPEWYSNPRDSFRSLWDSINDKRGCGWDANPWVWVIEFVQVQK